MATPKKDSRKAIRNKQMVELIRLVPEVKPVALRVLRFWHDVAHESRKRLSTIPRQERPDWYENMLTYWKHAERAFAWAIKSTESMGTDHGIAPRHSPQVADSVLPVGSDEAASRYRERLRAWVEPL